MIRRLLQSRGCSLDREGGISGIQGAGLPRIKILTRGVRGSFALLGMGLTFLLWESQPPEVPSAVRADVVVARTLAFSPDGRSIYASGMDRKTTAWDTRSGDARTVVLCRAEGCMSATLSPGGRVLAVENHDATVTLWDTDSGQRHADFPALSGDAHAMTFSRDGGTLALADDTEVRLCETRTGRLRARSRLGPGSVSRLALAPDGRTIALGLKDGAIRIWDVDAGGPEIVIHAHPGPLSALEFADGGRLLASASSADRVARLWEVAGGRLLAELRGHTMAVQSATFAPDGRMLATAGADRTVRLWDTSTGRLVHVFSGNYAPFTAVAFSADGRLLAGGGPGSLRLWDLNATTKSMPR